MSEDKPPLTRRVEAVEPGGCTRDGFSCCVIGADVTLDPSDLASYYSGRWEPVIYDALLLTAVVEYCDRKHKRPRGGWGRPFEVLMRVDEPARWECPSVKDAVSDALGKLSGDRWDLSFVQRRAPYPGIQASFQWPQPAPVIMPFSDGMDSRMVATLPREEPLVLMRLGDKQIDCPEVDGLMRAFTTVPYGVPGRRFSENSGRARGFKFAMLGALAAYLAQGRRIVVPESGQGALGPVLVGHHDGDYRSHPVFLRKIEGLVKALLDWEVAFEFPRLWSTKGQTLREAIAADPKMRWRQTRSCWQPNTQMSVRRRKRQCGFCASCVLRRLSVHAAGESEAPDAYMLEDLSAPSLEAGLAAGFSLGRHRKAQQTYAIAGALHLDQLAALSSTTEKPQSFHRKVRELARALGQTEADVARQVLRMLAQHEAEWRAFLRSLAPTSFIRQRSMAVS
jgi:hypothetical protein